MKRHYVKSYNWFFNVNQVSSDKHYKLKEYRFLRIRRVKIEDSGKYTCVVENNIGKSKMVYNLFVRRKLKRARFVFNDCSSSEKCVSRCL